jgi:hypothetical protein
MFSSFQVYVQNLNGVNYVLEAKDLTDYIDAEKSVVKVRLYISNIFNVFQLSYIQVF